MTMANKYDLYILVADDGQVDESFENYREAFREYQKIDAPKTLYGRYEDGSLSVIFSKG